MSGATPVLRLLALLATIVPLAACDSGSADLAARVRQAARADAARELRELCAAADDASRVAAGPATGALVARLEKQARRSDTLARAAFAGFSEGARVACGETVARAATAGLTDGVNARDLARVLRRASARLHEAEATRPDAEDRRSFNAHVYWAWTSERDR